MVLELELPLVVPFAERVAVVDDHAVVEDRDTGRLVALGGVEDDVVGLPLAGLAAGVDEGRGLSIEGAGLSPGVGVVLEGIENLHLAVVSKVDAAVAAALSAAFDLAGSGPLDVQLGVAE